VALVEAQDKKHTAIIAIGANIGDREKNIIDAINYIIEEGIDVVKVSSIIETEPYGYLDQPKFLNLVIEVKTDKTPQELLSTLLEIERKLKRERKIRFGPRTIDLDIIFYDDLIVEEENLTIPHKDMQNRYFVLKPLSEIEPDYIHPVLKKSVKELLKELSEGRKWSLQLGM